MMSDVLSISVVIPVYNGEAFLGQAIQSVLDQRHPILDILVIDDGSTDRSAQVARRFGDSVRYFYQPNAGVAAARNAGLGHATGELVGFLDQDDRWAEDKLAVMLPHFSNDPALDAMYGTTIEAYVDPNGDRKVGLEQGRRVFQPLLGSALFRRSVFEKVGRFDADIRYYADDVDFFLRLRENEVNIRYIDHVALYHQLHGGNASLNMDSPARIFFVEAIKKSLDRRRAAKDMRVSPLPEFIRQMAEQDDAEESHE